MQLVNEAAAEMAIGTAILEARKELGMTGDELARRAEVSLPLIYLVENGHKRPSVAALLNIAEALSLGPSPLMALAELMLRADKAMNGMRGPSASEDPPTPKNGSSRSGPARPALSSQRQGMT